MEQICRKCNELKTHSLRPNGRPQSWCKDCQKAYSKEHYENHKSLHNKRRYQNQKVQRGRLRNWIREVKAKPCVDCGIQYPYYVMQFDHIDSKNFTIANAIHKKTQNQLEQEIAKCDIVCANCHAERTYKRTH